MRGLVYRIAIAFLYSIICTGFIRGQNQPPILFNTNFEGGALGKIETISSTHFICNVPGQYNHQGRNRQASWYYFRMENVKGRDITLELADLIGEYNYRPGSHSITKETRPVYSYEGQTWRHFESMGWNEELVRGILRFRPEEDHIWIAHVQPYTTADLSRLLEDIKASPHQRTEVIGKTVQDRDIHLVTITNFDQPDENKRAVWLLARQHAWETGTSFAAEGAIRYLLSEDREARHIRDRVIFKIVPMADPDGVALGGVRFNINGYDLNRHWEEVDLRHPGYLERMPEIWYLKKAIITYARAQKPIDLLVYLHNTENQSFIHDAPAGNTGMKRRVDRFFNLLVKETKFDAAFKPEKRPAENSTTSMALYREAGILALLMELKVEYDQTLKRYPTAADRTTFGAGLARCMAKAILEE
ncbi:MAG: hypothetical protein JSW54_13750 [Fidelibacterota bacterium]|nr:MAG: hypothetical protein JSW54_13750 [Candidatus Neomarinimicrobiota bacterium]